jgi:DNA-binding NarL/FixJ family response regulator
LDKITNIIIIEDHPVVRNGLSAFFRGTGRWKIMGTAASLAEAKKLFADVSGNSVCADIVLLDIQLEDGWGLDLITWLTTQSGQKLYTMPLLAVYSAFDDYAHVRAALSMGVKVYVTKRRSEQELENALRQTLDGEPYIDEVAQQKLQTITDLCSLLTKRETELLNMVKRGLSNKEISSQLGISRRTVENILSCVYDKTGIKSRLELERL